MPPSLRNKALDFLARREHSRFELRKKLATSGEVEESAIEEILDVLEAEHLLSDERMAEAFVRARIGRGKGPRWIAQELRQRGVDDIIIDNVLNQSDNNWLDRGRKVCIRKFGEEPARTLEERARRSRFLIYRGFRPDQAEAILRTLGNPDDAPDDAPDDVLD